MNQSVGEDRDRLLHKLSAWERGQLAPAPGSCLPPLRSLTLPARQGSLRSLTLPARQDASRFANLRDDNLGKIAPKKDL